MISSLECFLRIVYFEQICLVLNSKSINQYTNVVQSQVIRHVFMTVIAAGGTTWTRCLGHTPVRISVGSPIWRHCLASTAHWAETYGYIPALSWGNQWAGRWEHFFFFFFHTEASLPQLLAPPAPQLHYGDVVKRDQCQKKGGCKPPSTISHPKATGQLAIRPVYIDLHSLHEGRDTTPCSALHCMGET